MCNVIYINPVDRCQLCNTEFGPDVPMYDASIKGQGWANICDVCFTAYDCKTGLGLGQKYTLQEIGENKTAWVKVEG